MTPKELIEQIEEFEENLDKDENEIDFTMLKMLQSILKSKEANTKTKEHQLLEQQVDEMVNSILERPDYYFDTKERNIEKMIQKSNARHALPKTDQEKEAIHNQTNLEVFDKLLSNLSRITKNPEYKQQLDSLKKELKKVNARNSRKIVNNEIRKASKKAKAILQKERIFGM